MKDQRGLYYYPFPQNKNVRMYVRKQEDVVCFRMWNSDDPELWVEHGWVPFQAIRQAAAMYEGKEFDPNAAYDIQAANDLLSEKE